MEIIPRTMLQLLVGFLLLRVAYRLIIPKPIRNILSKISSKIVNIIVYEFEFLFLRLTDKDK